MLLAVLWQCAFFTTMNEKAMDSFQSFRASPHYAFISLQQEHLRLAMHEKAMGSFQSFRASPYYAFISSQQEHLRLAMQETINETKYYVSSHLGGLFEDDADDGHDNYEQPYMLSGLITRKNNSVLFGNEGTADDGYWRFFSTATRQTVAMDHSLVG
jgi:hypothetical protein